MTQLQQVLRTRAITTRDLAALTGLSQRTCARAAAGRAIRPDNQLVISIKLGVPMPELFPT